MRRDLEEIVATAAQAGLYTNLITAGVLLTRARLEELAARGLDHLQLSIQDVAPGNADRIARYEGAHAKKRTLAAWVGDLGNPQTSILTREFSMGSGYWCVRGPLGGSGG